MNRMDQRSLPVQLRLLGGFELQSDQNAAAVAMGRKVRAMLACLAIAPGTAWPREKLMALLWGDRAEEQARASLRQAIAELRAIPSFEPALRTSRDLLELVGDRFAVDFQEIGRAAQRDELPALSTLLECVGGDLLEDLSDLSPGFDEWLLMERPRYRDEIIAASLAAVEKDALQDVRNARNILRSLDRIDPCNEAVARLGMRLDHAAADMPALHRRHRNLQDRLKAEFGVAPSEETRKLFHALLSSHSPARAPPEERRPRPNLDLELIPTVIVAPLQAYGDGADLASLAAFCSDDIRASLSVIRGIRVLDARTSNIDQLIERCEDALGLYLLSGSARMAGSELRVTLQLSNAADQRILWSDSLRLADDGASLIDRIVARAAGAVKPAIDRELAIRLKAAPAEATDIGDTRALYTRARLLTRFADTLAQAQEGARLLEEVIRHDPSHLGAHLLLARMYNTDFWQQICGHDVAGYRAISDRHMRAASAIAPGRVDVRVRRAWCFLRAGQCEHAERELDTALEGLSHDPDIVNECALAQCLLGNFERSHDLMQRAFFINPFPTSDYHADYAILLALKGDAQSAEDHFLVSGATGMFYTMVRIANATHLPASAVDLRVLVDDFIARFTRAWQREDKPSLDDVMDWVGYTLPLNPARNLEFVRSGLRMSLEPLWPAA